MKITTISLLINFIIFLFGNNLFSQEPSFEWGIQIDLNDTSYAGDRSPLLAIDKDGNLYAAGYFYETVDFDPGPDSMILTSLGGSDIFIQKLDTNGNLLWVKQIGGTGDEYITSLSIDGGGNIYSTGSFSGGVDFDPGIGVETNFGIYDQNSFVLKLDLDGDFEWVEKFGGSSLATFISSSFDVQGNFYTTGIFWPDYYPGVGPALSCRGYIDAFIQKLDTAGNVSWVKQIGEDRIVIPFTDGTGIVIPSAIVLDEFNNSYLVGIFVDTIDFDPGAGVSELYSKDPETREIFILKLDSNGDFLWVRQIGNQRPGNNNLSGMDIRDLKIDQNGDLYMTGLFSRSLDFDPGINEFYITAVDVQDAFVLKLNGDGNFIWAKQIGGVDVDEGNALTVDKRGNLFVTGIFSEQVDFDPGFDTSYLSAGSKYNTFILNLDTAGNFKWVKQLEGTGLNTGESIVSDKNKNVYTAGFFNDTLDFDTESGTKNVISNDVSDIFIHKLGPCKNTFFVDSIVTCGAYTWIDNVKYSTSNSTATFKTKNTSGCDSVVQLHLTINQVSDISVSSEGFKLFSNNLNATAYQWLNCDSSYSIIIDSTGRSFTAPRNGSYAVQLTENNCIDTSECVAISVGLVENYDPNFLNVFPNPSKGNFNIDLNNELSQIEISIYNVHGKLVQNSVYRNRKTINIKIDSQAPGIYFVELKTKNGIQVVRLIKE